MSYKSYSYQPAAKYSPPASSSFFPGGEEVVELTDSTFNERVLQSKRLWLVVFYTPWCGYCKQMAPEWAKAAKSLKGIAKLGAVNMDHEHSVSSRYGIRSLPTIKVFGLHKSSPMEYHGGRTAQSFVDKATSQQQQMMSGSRRRGGSGGSI